MRDSLSTCLQVSKSKLKGSIDDVLLNSCVNYVCNASYLTQIIKFIYQSAFTINTYYSR